MTTLIVLIYIILAGVSFAALTERVRRSHAQPRYPVIAAGAVAWPVVIAAFVIAFLLDLMLLPVNLFRLWRAARASR